MNPLGPYHNPNVSCAFHARYIRYTVEECHVFKNRVQDLIDQNIMPFTEEKPNAKANPLSNHSNHAVNSIIEEDNSEVVHLVENVKTPWLVIS